MSNQNPSQPRTSPANNKMLIDATHPEETRVVVLRNGRVEEFDYESAARKLLRGNIYLAKVTRVEPSLQAAFVDYGGNRHGFLAFNEIHPDYYQIPVADRRALIEAETAAEAEEEAAADRAAEYAASRRERSRSRHAPPADVETIDAEDSAIEVASMLPPETVEAESTNGGERVHVDASHDDAGPAIERGDEPARSMLERVEPDVGVASPAYEPPVDIEPRREAPASEADIPRAATDGDESMRYAAPAEEIGESGNGDGQVESVEAGNGAEADQIETVSTSEDALEEVPTRPRRRLRSYKIQEVIKRRQVLLIQVVKEERGTKGAALTTYLSLAGRYTVLMPNTARGGGISRKITNPQDRKRLKAIAAELDVPEGMGLIIRTAGAARTKQEIKRDYEYLLRLWESVRELALNSNAPTLVYEEGNLIKRSIRDLYGKEVDEIVVAGDDAYKEAKDFMRMLMPSHAKNVIFYQEPEPLFTRFHMERQLGAMFSPYVHLRSGGYLVINQTEALVAIDINSGKSTREFSIEETALSTNLEAADEIARQLKLRDLAGLIVIDFIDMEEKRNNRAVERRLKDALRHDRARIQLGRISHFGLLEMSRQRMRTGVLEGSTTQCPHCQGTGIIRSTESVALAVLRGLEDALMSGHPSSLTATTTATVALYILNNKRTFITEMESRHGITIQIQASEKVQGANFTIEKQARRDEPQRRPERAAVNMDWGFEDEDGEGVVEGVVEVDVEADGGDEHEAGNGHGERGGSRDSGEGRRKRRRRRGRRGEQGGEQRQPHHAMQRDDGGESEAGYVGGEDQTEYPDEDRRPEAAYRGEPAEQDDERDVEGETEERGSYARQEGGEGEGAERRGRRRRRGRRGGRRGQEREPGQPLEGRGDDDRQPEQPVEQDWRSPVASGEDDQPRIDVVPAAWAQVHGEPAGSPPHGESPRQNGAEHGRAAVVAETVHVDETVPSHPVLVEPPVRSEDPVPAAAILPPMDAAPKAEPVPPEQPVPEQPVAPQPSPRSAPVASEPVLERVVVGPDNVAGPPPGEPKPARRGWWQRR